MNIEAARNQMIEQQVHTWEVFDEQVLEAMRQVRRELFMPAAYRDVAFADAPIPLPHGQSFLSPKVQGRILQALSLSPADVALEIGTGSGYLTACIAKLCSRVRGLEIVPELAELSRANLLASAVNNAAVEVGDGMQLDETQQYDAIAVTGSLAVYDERFQRALKIGGRLFVIVGTAPIMEAWKVTRLGEREWQREGLFETVVEPLVNSARATQFVF
jgi:protein-L-isoaspartate(D-aspartate) O-methyltransferase